MSILSASTGLTRYRVADTPTDEMLREVPEKLKQFAFVDIDATADERSFGWTNFDNMLDVKWNQSPPEKGHFFAFALRLETRRVSAAVLKKHFNIALEAELEQAKKDGKKYVSRARKMEIKERVKLKLMARAMPIPAVFEAAWNIRDGRIYLETTNAKVKSLFEDYFNQTFELRLEELSPFFLALDMLGEDKAGTLENLEPTSFA